MPEVVGRGCLVVVCRGGAAYWVAARVKDGAIVSRSSGWCPISSFSSNNGMTLGKSLSIAKPEKTVIEVDA